MDKDGFLEDVQCLKCGKELSASDSPVEAYAGTYTGLCNGCTKSEPFVEKRHFDGAVTISYPPHTPSHRRGRRKFHAWEDCDECGGTGRKYVNRSMGRGGGYYESCSTCGPRFWDNPLRKWDENRRIDLMDRANNVFRDLVKERGMDVDVAYKKTIERLRELQQKQQAEYERKQKSYTETN